MPRDIIKEIFGPGPLKKIVGSPKDIFGPLFGSKQEIEEIPESEEISEEVEEEVKAEE